MGQLVLASNANVAENFFCVECGEPVLLKSSKNGLFFYTHHSYKTNDLEGESVNHLLGKQAIYCWAKQKGLNPEIEKHLSKINQRPDILFRINNQRFVIEYQCSPISVKKLIQRNDGYKKENIKAIWVLGENYRKKSGKINQAKFVQKYHGKYCLLFWNMSINKLEPVLCRKKVLTQRSVLRETLLMHNVYHKHKRTRKLFEGFYSKGLNLAACPLFVHDNIQSISLLKERELNWKLEILLSILNRSVGTTWSSNDWVTWIYQHTEWLEMPCLQSADISALRAKLIKQLTVNLINNKWLKYHSNKIIWTGNYNWYSNIDLKIYDIKRASHY